MTKFLPEKDVRDFIVLVGKKIFTITFIRLDGTVRKMVGHFGVRKDLAGGVFPGRHIPKLHSIFDMQADGYRSFYVDRVVFMKCGPNSIGTQT